MVGNFAAAARETQLPATKTMITSSDDANLNIVSHILVRHLSVDPLKKVTIAPNACVFSNVPITSGPRQ